MFVLLMLGCRVWQVASVGVLNISCPETNIEGSCFYEALKTFLLISSLLIGVLQAYSPAP